MLSYEELIKDFSPTIDHLKERLDYAKRACSLSDITERHVAYTQVQQALYEGEQFLFYLRESLDRKAIEEMMQYKREHGRDVYDDIPGYLGRVLGYDEKAGVPEKE